MLPDGIITDVTGHEKIKTHEVTLNQNDEVICKYIFLSDGP